MTVFTSNFSGNSSFKLDLDVYESSTNEAANQSTVTWTLTIRNTGSTYPWAFDPQPWSVNIGGNPDSNTFTYDFRNYSSLKLAGPGNFTFTHNDDGSKTINVKADVSTVGFGSASINQNFPLSDFTRVPSAPASVSATISGRNVSVTSGIADATGKPAISSYQVERTTPNNIAWSGTVITMDGSRQYTYSNLDGGKTYRFRTRAVNSEGVSPWVESTIYFVPAGGKRWTGSSWDATQTAKRWNGSSWVDLTIAKRWDGSAWVDLS